MDYTSRTRDRFRWAATGLTGIVTAGALVGTGALAGRMAADQHAAGAAEQQRQAEQTAAWRAQRAAYDARIARLRAAPRVILKQRPERTRVTTRYITSSSGSAGSTGSGSVSVSASKASYAGSTRTHTSSHTGGHSGGTASAPPPPPPPPASSGS